MEELPVLRAEEETPTPSGKLLFPQDLIYLKDRKTEKERERHRAHKSTSRGSSRERGRSRLPF